MIAVSVSALVLLVILVGWRGRPVVDGRRLGDTPARRWARPRWLRRAAIVDAVALAEYLEALSRELRVGEPLAAAFASVTPAHAAVSAAFGPARDLVAAGRPLSAALEVIATRIHGADVALAVQALSCAAAIGGPAAATLDGAGAVLRGRAAMAADIRAQSAQARLSARVLTIVPVAFATWSFATSARNRQTYLDSAVAATCLVAGAALNLAGWWWMRRIVGQGAR
jgi:tight adherence protein B